MQPFPIKSFNNRMENDQSLLDHPHRPPCPPTSPTMFFWKAALINMINKGITAKITRMSTTNLNLTPVTTSWTLKRSVWYFSSPFVELFDTHGRREETEAGLEEANIATFWERKNWSITSRGHTYVAQVWIINVAKDTSFFLGGHCHQQDSCEETVYPDVASYLILYVIFLSSVWELL